MKSAKIAWSLAYLLLSKGAIASPHTWSGATSTDWTAGTNWDSPLNPSGETAQLLTFPPDATNFTSTYTGSPSALFINSMTLSTVGDGTGSNFYTIGGANSSTPIVMSNTSGNATITINQPVVSDGIGPRLAYLDIQSPTTITTNMTLFGVDPNAGTGIDRNTVLNNLMGSQALTLTGNPQGGFTLDSNTAFTGNILIGDSLNSTTSSVIAGANCFGSGTVTLQNGSLIVPYNGALTTIPNDFILEGACSITAQGLTAFSGTLLSSGQSLTLAGSGSVTFSEICVDNSSGNEVTFTISGPWRGDQIVGWEKTGAGTLIIDGDVTDQAHELRIQEGAVVIKQNIYSSVAVSANATFSGSGTSNIQGSLHLQEEDANLILGPFYNTEKLTIENSYFLADGAIQTNILGNPDSPQNGSTTLLLVKENVGIGPTARCIIDCVTNPAGYKDGTTFEIINASEGQITGQFGELILMPPLITGYLDYSDANIVKYIMSVEQIASSAMTGNAAAVANTLNRIGYTADTSVDGVIRSILALSSDAEKYDALNQLHPALYKGAALVQENNAVQVRNAISQRLQVIVDNQSCSNSVKNKSCKTSGDTSQFWLSGIGDFLKQESTFYANNPSIGYRANSVGVVTGLDHQFAPFFYLGAMGGYTHSNVKSQNNKGRAKIDSGYGGLYFSAIGKLFYGNLSLIGAWNGFDKQRNIIFPNINLTANSSHVGQQLTSHLDSGLYLSVGKGITLRPFDSFDWIVQKENSYCETGAGEYNLAVSKSHANMLRNELGMSLAACRDLRGTRVSRVSLDTKIGWVREVRMAGKNSEAEFVSTDIPAPFTVAGYFPNRSLVSVGASVTAVALHDRLTCTLHYSGVFGAKYSDNGLSGQIGLSF